MFSRKVFFYQTFTLHHQCSQKDFEQIFFITLLNLFSMFIVYNHNKYHYFTHLNYTSLYFYVNSWYVLYISQQILFKLYISVSQFSQLKLNLHVSRYAFLLTSPAVAVYLISYFVIIRVPRQQRRSVSNQVTDEREPFLGDSSSIQGKL